MNDEDIEKIAKRVAELLYDLAANPKAYEDSFVIPKQDQEQVLLAELARLMTLLSSYEDKEEYSKAAIVHNKLKILESKLNKL